MGNGGRRRSSDERRTGSRAGVRASYALLMACARHPVVSTLMLAAAVSSCRCAPLREERTLADLHVAVDAEQGRITVAHGDTVLLDMLVDAQARALGVKDGDASYAMEFGMFDIQEDLGAYRFADRLEIEA